MADDKQGGKKKGGMSRCCCCLILFLLAAVGGLFAYVYFGIYEPAMAEEPLDFDPQEIPGTALDAVRLKFQGEEFLSGLVGEITGEVKVTLVRETRIVEYAR